MAEPGGRWRTFDDATGRAKSIVEIQRGRDGSYMGRVVAILDLTDGADPPCNACKGSNAGKPIKGMTILWGLRADGPGRWSGGTVLDPENGKRYRSRIELKAGGRKLGMSGCVAFICREQTWVRE